MANIEGDGVTDEELSQAVQTLTNQINSLSGDLAAHGHEISGVSGLQSALDTLQTNIDNINAGGGVDLSNYYTIDEVDTALVSKADADSVSNVDNTSDADKPISTATQAALDAKPDNASDIGLGNVDNTSDANKPISAATQAALDNKSDENHTHSIDDVSGLNAALDALSSAGVNRVIISADQVAIAEQIIAVDSSVGPITVTAPEAPEENTYFYVGDAKANAETNNITVQFNATDKFIIDRNQIGFGFLFVGASWEVFK